MKMIRMMKTWKCKPLKKSTKMKRKRKSRMTKVDEKWNALTVANWQVLVKTMKGMKCAQSAVVFFILGLMTRNSKKQEVIFVAMREVIWWDEIKNLLVHCCIVWLLMGVVANKCIRYCTTNNQRIFGLMCITSVIELCQTNFASVIHINNVVIK